MTITSFVVVFVVLWWLVFFMVLPVGIVTDKAEGGNMNGAPKNPNLKIKAIITTILTAILTAAYFYMVENGYIVFGQ